MNMLINKRGAPPTKHLKLACTRFLEDQTAFFTITVRSFLFDSIRYSSASPGLSSKKTAMSSGTVALSDFSIGRAIDVFDLRLMNTLPSFKKL